MSVADPNVLSKVVKYLSEPPADAPTGAAGSILTVAAASYGARPVDQEMTIPTGFDPLAAALFEAVVEAAYLVASADGDFDDEERRAFEQVVYKACGKGISERQIQALVADLEEQLHEDGVEQRVAMVGRTVSIEEHQREVLRVAALLAHVSGGVSDVERTVLERLAQAFGVGNAAVDDAVREVKEAVGA